MSMLYVAINQTCGHVRGVAVDPASDGGSKQEAKEVGRMVSDWIRRGYRVERITHEALGPDSWKGCDTCIPLRAGRGSHVEGR